MSCPKTLSLPEKQEISKNLRLGGGFVVFFWVGGEGR